MAPNSTLYPFLELEAGSVPASLNFAQLDFVKPSSGFHPVTWERVREYLFKWKGYHPIEASWVNESNMEHAQKAIEEFHTRPTNKRHRT